MNAFTFDQIEAGCAALREYGDEAIKNYQEGIPDPSELKFLRRIAEVLANPEGVR